MSKLHGKIKRAVALALLALTCLIFCSCSVAEINLSADGSGTATVRIAKNYTDGDGPVTLTENDVRERIDRLVYATELSSGEEDRLTLTSLEDNGEYFTARFSFMRLQYISQYGGDVGYYTYKKASDFVLESDSVATLTDYWYGGSYKSYLKCYENKKYTFSNYKRPDADAAIVAKTASGEALTEEETRSLFSPGSAFASDDKAYVFTFFIADMEGLEEITFRFDGDVSYYGGVNAAANGDSLTIRPLAQKAQTTYVDKDGEVRSETSDVNCFVGYACIVLKPNKLLIGLFIALGAIAAGFIVYGFVSGLFKRVFTGKAVMSVLRNYDLYLMVLPGIALLFLFAYLPMGGVILAFKNYKTVDGIWGSEFTSMFGMRNFYELFTTSANFWSLVKNTVLLALWKFIFGFLIAIVLAVLFSYLKNGIFKKTVQTISYFPYFISWVVISTISYLFLATDGGILNNLITRLGGEGINWYASPGYWPFILTFTAMWRTAGYSTIVYLAAIININQSLYEAARIDGAGRVQQLLHITVPGLMPVLGIQIVFSLGNLFRDDFDQIYTMVRGSALLRDTTDTIGKIAFENISSPAAYGITSAMGLMQGLVSLIIVVASNRILKHFDIQGAF